MHLCTADHSVKPALGLTGIERSRGATSKAAQGLDPLQKFRKCRQAESRNEEANSGIPRALRAPRRRGSALRPTG